MTNCRNCGHESHCGTKLMKDFRGHKGVGAIKGQIEICKFCRCEKCTAPDWGQENKMAESYNILYCNSCHHECHCDKLVCSHLVGVGMSDKSVPCGCDVCKCSKDNGTV